MGQIQGSNYHLPEIHLFKKSGALLFKVKIIFSEYMSAKCLRIWSVKIIAIFVDVS